MGTYRFCPTFPSDCLKRSNAGFSNYPAHEGSKKGFLVGALLLRRGTFTLPLLVSQLQRQCRSSELCEREFGEGDTCTLHMEPVIVFLAPVCDLESCRQRERSARLGARAAVATGCCLAAAGEPDVHTHKVCSTDEDRMSFSRVGEITLAANSMSEDSRVRLHDKKQT